MKTLEEIKIAIQDLSDLDRRLLMDWLDAEIWDNKMEKALEDGIFDDLIEKAIAEDDAGKTEEL